MIHYKEITIGELYAFVTSDAYKEAEVVPISTHRAISYIKNPRADANDGILFLAYNEEDRMVGYLGIMPDHVFNENKKEKIGWMSCIWVDENSRGQGIAEKLLDNAFNSWKWHVLVTEFTAPARKVYMKTGKFDEMITLYGIRAYLRFNLHKLLPPKKESYKTLSPILKMVDASANVLNDIRINLKKPDQQYEVVKKLDDDILAFINERNKNETFRRGKEDLEWVKDYPWLKVADKKDAEAVKYHFSSVAKQFYNQFIKISKDGKMIGFAMIAVREQHLKLPSIYFDKEDTEAVVKGIIKLMTDRKLNMLTTYDPYISEQILCDPMSFYNVRPFQREYLISKKVNEKPIMQQEIILQDGDGDCAFT